MMDSVESDELATSAVQMRRMQTPGVLDRAPGSKRVLGSLTSVLQVGGASKMTVARSHEGRRSAFRGPHGYSARCGDAKSSFELRWRLASRDLC